MAGSSRPCLSVFFSCLHLAASRFKGSPKINDYDTRYVVICPISLEKLTGINEHIGSVYLCIIFLTVEQERPFVCNMYQDTQNVSNIALFAPFYEKIEHH
jgi:hypothetical protein